MGLAMPLMASPLVGQEHASTPTFRQRVQMRASRIRRDTGANVSLTAGIALAFAIVGGIVALLIVANLAPTVITAGANVTTAIKTTDFGDDTVNSLRGVFGLLVGLGVLAGIVALALAAVYFKKE